MSCHKIARAGFIGRFGDCSIHFYVPAFDGLNRESAGFE
jgi:hypothetical protein